MVVVCENWPKISTMPKNHHRRMSVEMDKVSMNAQRMKQRRVSVETENPSLGGYLHRRRWSSDSIHHFTEALHLSFHWKRRTTLPVVTLGAEGEVTPPPLHHKHGHTHSSFISFTRTVSATLRKRKNPIPALAVVVLEDGVVELVRILLFIIVLDFVFFCYIWSGVQITVFLCRVNEDVNYNDLISYDVYELCIVHHTVLDVTVDQTPSV